MLYIIDNKPELSKEDICGLVLQEAKCDELVIEIETDIELRELEDPTENGTIVKQILKSGKLKS